MNNAVIYARYSSHAQRDVSIEQQEKAVREYCSAQGLDVLRVYADRAMTGTNDKRPQFQRMISDADRGDFDYIVVYTLDRFARDRYDSAIYKRELKKRGVRVLSAMESINDDPTGILMESVLEGLAEYYSAELSRKINRGMADNAERCMVNGALPYGYKRGEDGRYQIIEAEAAIVREIFRRVAEGEQITAIWRDLNRRGIPNKRGGEWSNSSFNVLLRNERYKGVYIYKDVRIDGGIPRIIDDELFDAVQVRLAERKRGGTGRRQTNDLYLLTGKLYCGECGAAMVGVSGSGRSATYSYYKCRGHIADASSCGLKPISKDAAEEAIAAAIKKYALTDDAINWIADAAVLSQMDSSEPPEMEIIKAQLAENKKASANIVRAIEAGAFSMTLQTRLTELEASTLELNEKLLTMESQRRRIIPRGVIVDWLRQFRDGDVKDKSYQAAIIDSFLIRATLYGDRWEIDIRLDNKKTVRIKESLSHQSFSMRTAGHLSVSGLVCRITMPRSEAETPTTRTKKILARG